jgi:hypothetical protein
MELNEKIYPSQTIRNGTQTLAGLAAGTTVKIKLEGEELLSASVPRNKTWDAIVSIEIIERDA